MGITFCSLSYSFSIKSKKIIKLTIKLKKKQHYVYIDDLLVSEFMYFRIFGFYLSLYSILYKSKMFLFIFDPL